MQRERERERERNLMFERKAKITITENDIEFFSERMSCVSGFGRGAPYKLCKSQLGLASFQV